MASIGQTTLKKIRLTSWLLEADELIGIFQGRISIRARGVYPQSISRIHDCSQSFFASIIFLTKALTQPAGPYMRLSKPLALHLDLQCCY